jgi:hypothetical protein
MLEHGLANYVMQADLVCVSIAHLFFSSASVRNYNMECSLVIGNSIVTIYLIIVDNSNYF